MYWSWAWYTGIIQGQVSNKEHCKNNLTVGEDGVQDVKENIVEDSIEHIGIKKKIIEAISR